MVYYLVRGHISREMVVYLTARDQRAKLFGLCHHFPGCDLHGNYCGDQFVLDLVAEQKAKEKPVILISHLFADIGLHRLIGCRL